ncbi:hypothetical protein NL676_026622 [Syzygium grande]|nr:hypothetical protein NL676_026622 [Syzygium grande]
MTDRKSSGLFLSFLASPCPLRIVGRCVRLDEGGRGGRVGLSLSSARLAARCRERKVAKKRKEEEGLLRSPSRTSAPK